MLRVAVIGGAGLATYKRVRRLLGELESLPGTTALIGVDRTGASKFAAAQARNYHLIPVLVEGPETVAVELATEVWCLEYCKENHDYETKRALERAELLRIPVYHYHDNTTETDCTGWSELFKRARATRSGAPYDDPARVDGGVG